MGMNVGYLTAGRGPESDECMTGYYAVSPLLKYIPKDWTIWCPCDEEWSAYYNTFKENGYNVIRSSIKEGQDFFRIRTRRTLRLHNNESTVFQKR